MNLQAVKSFFPELDLRQKQVTNISFITFWSQFAVYAFNTVLVLFLTRPVLKHGLGYSDVKAYAFIGVSQATNYLMPMLGGFMADQVVGIRRSILLGSIMLAFAYLLVMLSGYTVGNSGDYFFIAAYAFIPVTNSLLMGTASGLISTIYSDDAIKAKEAMTYYYIAINVGSILAISLAPILLESKYGPLSVMTIAFIGKSLAALNFTRRYELYSNVIRGRDLKAFRLNDSLKLVLYIAVVYGLTLLAYTHIQLAGLFISLGCVLGIIWFLQKTLSLTGPTKTKQLIAVLLIIEAIIFFILYNQMNSTLVLFAENNTNLKLFGLSVSPAHYQILNPLLIMILGFQLPKLYAAFPKFTIPYQFASGTLIAGLGVLIMAVASAYADQGLVNGNYLALTYIFITLAELLVSAVGLSMIGLYCDNRTIAFAMGIWYLASALSNTIAGRIAAWVAIPLQINAASESLPYYQTFYLIMGLSAMGLGIVMLYLAKILDKHFTNRGIILD